MPYTLAHLPAVIPLARRRWLVVSALILGSMAPDIEYYLRMDLKTGRLGHMGWGVIGFSLPAGLLALWAFHAWIKAPALALLPERHRVALAPFGGPFRFFPAKRFLAIVFSVLLGLGLHVFLDMVTHPDGWSGAPLAVMEYPLIRVGTGSVALSDVMHLGVSVLGVVAAWIWYRRWIRRQAPPVAAGLAGWRTWPRRWWAALRRGDPRVRVLVPMAGVALTFGLAYGVAQAEALDTYRQWRTLAGRCLVGGTTVFVFQFTVFGILWQRSPSLRTMVVCRPPPPCAAGEADDGGLRTPATLRRG